jgi:hypothetical protein
VQNQRLEEEEDEAEEPLEKRRHKTALSTNKAQKCKSGLWAWPK